MWRDRDELIKEVKNLAGFMKMFAVGLIGISSYHYVACACCRYAGCEGVDNGFSHRSGGADDLHEDFIPDINVSVSAPVQVDGIKALIDKTTDIATSSRDIKKEEIDMARERGVYPVAHRIAIDAIVPIVHPANPVKDLTTEQLNLISRAR